MILGEDGSLQALGTLVPACVLVIEAVDNSQSPQPWRWAHAQHGKFNLVILVNVTNMCFGSKVFASCLAAPVFPLFGGLPTKLFDAKTSSQFILVTLVASGFCFS